MPKHRKTPRKVLARPAKPYPNCFRRQVCDKAPGWRHRQRRQQDKELEELEAQPETKTETPLEAQMIAWRPPEPYPHDEQMTKSCMRPQDTQPDPDKKVTWQKNMKNPVVFDDTVNPPWAVPRLAVPYDQYHEDDDSTKAVNGAEIISPPDVPYAQHHADDDSVVPPPAVPPPAAPYAQHHADDDDSSYGEEFKTSPEVLAETVIPQPDLPQVQEEHDYSKDVNEEEFMTSPEVSVETVIPPADLLQVQEEHDDSKDVNEEEFMISPEASVETVIPPADLPYAQVEEEHDDSKDVDEEEHMTIPEVFDETVIPPVDFPYALVQEEHDDSKDVDEEENMTLPEDFDETFTDSPTLPYAQDQEAEYDSKDAGEEENKINGWETPQETFTPSPTLPYAHYREDDDKDSKNVGEEENKANYWESPIETFTPSPTLPYTQYLEADDKDSEDDSKNDAGEENKVNFWETPQAQSLPGAPSALPCTHYHEADDKDSEDDSKNDADKADEENKVGFWETPQAQSLSGAPSALPYAHYHEAADKDSEDDSKDDADKADEENKVGFWETPQAQSLCEDATSKESVSLFRAGSLRYETVQKMLCRVLDDAKFGLEAVLVDSIMEGVVNLFQKEYMKVFSAMELKLVKSFQKNTQRRRAMIERIEQHNANWNRDYLFLPGRVHETEMLSVDDSSDSTPPTSNDSGNAHPKEEGLHPNGEVEDGTEAPDWDDLEDQKHLPTLSRIHRYHMACDRFQNADEVFQNSLREIHERLEATTKAILQIVVDAYNPLDEDLHFTKCALQYKMVHNVERRQMLEKKVAESAKQQENIFARLMASLKGPTMDAAPGKKRKGGPGASGAEDERSIVLL